MSERCNRTSGKESVRAQSGSLGGIMVTAAGRGDAGAMWDSSQINATKARPMTIRSAVNWGKMKGDIYKEGDGGALPECLAGSSAHGTLGGAVAPLLGALAHGVEFKKRKKKDIEAHVEAPSPEILPSLRWRSDLQFNKSQCHLFSFYTFSWQRQAGAPPYEISFRRQRRP